MRAVGMGTIRLGRACRARLGRVRMGGWIAGMGGRRGRIAGRMRGGMVGGWGCRWRWGWVGG